MHSYVVWCPSSESELSLMVNNGHSDPFPLKILSVLGLGFKGKQRLRGSYKSGSGPACMEGKALYHQFADLLF